MKNKSFIIALSLSISLILLFVYFATTSSPITPSAPHHGNTEKTPFSMVPLSADLLIKPHSATQGPLTAKVTLVEFLDPECEACAAMHTIVKKLQAEFGASLRLVVRYMTFHENSKYIANILEGARAQNKYWETMEILFQTQHQWANHQNPRPDLVPKILKPLGLNLERILKDAQEGKFNKQIEEDFANGKEAGVTGTPTFFVNGHMAPTLGYQALKEEIERAIR